MRDRAEAAFLLDLEYRDGTWRESFSLPEQRVLEYPLDKVDFAAPNVTIAAPEKSFTLEGTVCEDAIAWVFKDGGRRGASVGAVTGRGALHQRGGPLRQR